MDITVKQVSSLEKIRSTNDMAYPDIQKVNILPGEHYSYQVVVVDKSNTIDRKVLKITIDSPIAEYVKIYSVKHTLVDFPCNDNVDDDYLTKQPCMMPDVLIPLEDQGGYASFVNSLATFWVEVCLPRDCCLDESYITLNISGTVFEYDTNQTNVAFELSTTMDFDIIPIPLPEQSIKFTQWFHVDCIASAHNVDVYSEKHWELIEKYIEMASDLGVNMLLTPVFTPALDTFPGTKRACTQLVKIKKSGAKYEFDFSLLRKYISLCKKHKIEYYEISHFFSQWGALYTPNIVIEENGEEQYAFGWHVRSNDKKYEDFLKIFIPELLNTLDEENILDSCYFHISDEPNEKQLKNYESARNILKPLLENCKIIDALSDIDFYEKGLVKTPVCAIDHIEPFLQKKVYGLWAYYCCAQGNDVSNRFMSMPSYRNRIIGLQLYKFGIEGFLHWGYNFYYSQYSLYNINPYTTTSSDGAFPSGDAFSVYPGKDGPVPSVRAFVFREALADIEICKVLEEKIGRDAVVRLIDGEADMELTFSQYPRNSVFINNLIDKMKLMIKEVV